MDKWIPYAKQSINDDDIKAVKLAMQGEMLTRGPQMQAFEEAVASFCGARFAVAFNSATSGLMAACFAAKVTPHDRIVTTPNTFIATVGAGCRFGASPLFVDIDIKSGNLDLNLLQHNVDYNSTRGRNIYIPVHFAGVPVDMERLEGMIKDPESVVIEDAAHAFGSRYKDGSKVGSCQWSQMTVFSFHPAKNITCGEGGIVTTNDEELKNRLLLYRNNGIEREPERLQGSPKPWYYEVQDITGNFHMTEMQAALGLSQMERVTAFAKKRLAHVNTYRDLLSSLPHIQFLEPSKDDKQIMYHLFVALIDFEAYGTTREKVMEALKERGVGSQVHYIPIYRHPYFAKNRRDISEYFPAMEEYYSKALSLPLYYDLSNGNIDTVVKALKESLHKSGTS